MVNEIFMGLEMCGYGIYIKALLGAAWVLIVCKVVDEILNFVAKIKYAGITDSAVGFYCKLFKDLKPLTKKWIRIMDKGIDKIEEDLDDM